jgi:hypothetical protein
MKRYSIFLMLVLIGLFNTSCIKRKCRDSSATNGAVISSGPSDNSLCIYSKVVFYTSSGYHLNSTINKIEIYINQVYVGDVTAVYANAPGNCTASGTLGYQFLDKNPIDWEAKIILTNGQIAYTNGVLNPSSNSCIIQDIFQ